MGKKMTKKIKKKPDPIYDFDTQLTQNESNKIHSAVTLVIKSIFRREKDPSKRVILINQISSCASYDAALESTRKIHILRKKMVEERNKR